MFLKICFEIIPYVHNSVSGFVKPVKRVISELHLQIVTSIVAELMINV